MSLSTAEIEFCDSDPTDRDAPRDPKVSLAFPRVRISPLADVGCEELPMLTVEACASPILFTAEAQVPEEDMVVGSWV